MTLTQLKYIVETAKAGASAGQLKSCIFPAQSDGSYPGTEHEFGITIFQRTNKGIILTSEGEEFLGYARRSLPRQA